MITVANANIETPIELTPENPVVLVEENPSEFYRAVSSLINAFSDEESGFTFWKGDEQISPSKHGEILTNTFGFDFADKKIINLLYKRLQNNFLEGSFQADFNLINAKICNFLSDLCSTVDFSLDFDELTTENLIKTCSVKPSAVYNSLLEKIICFINIFTSLKNISFFVFVDIKSVLSDDELQKLYKHCSLHKIALFLIESSKKRSFLAEEKAIIITDDLCEIVENFS